MRACVSCFFHGKCAGMICCNYIFKTGKMRPCPPGDECTVRVPYRKKHYPRKSKRVLANE